MNNNDNFTRHNKVVMHVKDGEAALWLISD